MAPVRIRGLRRATGLTSKRFATAKLAAAGFAHCYGGGPGLEPASTAGSPRQTMPPDFRTISIASSSDCS